MKLRNLLFGTMIACAFVACSSEDDPIDDGGNTQKGTASLKVMVKPVGTNTTKAITTGVGATDAEKAIDNLKIVLYDGSTGAYITEKAAESTDMYVEFTGLQAGTEVRALAVANMSGVTFTETTATNGNIVISAPTGGFATGDYLPMSSGVTGKILVEKDKTVYYGYKNDATITGNDVTNLNTDPLPLIRNVARVDVHSIKFDMTAATTTTYTQGTATFAASNAFIMHANSQSQAVAFESGYAWLDSSSPVWGSVYKAPTAAQYLSGLPATGGDLFENQTGSIGQTSYVADITDTKKTQDIAGDDAQAVTLPTAGIHFYVFENTVTETNDAEAKTAGAWATKLVIKGTFSLSDAVTTSGIKIADIAEATRYWPITVGVDGLATADEAVKGVHRNVIYQIDVTIAGKGRLDPTIPDPEEKGSVIVKTTVLDWAKVTQDTVIE